MTPTPTISPSSSPSRLLPLAPGAWCRYSASLDVIGGPGGPTLTALEKAAGGDLGDWKRLGPDLARRARDARQELEGLVGLDPVADVMNREATLLGAWIAALQASFADGAGKAEIDEVYSTYQDWQDNRIDFVNAMRLNFETACP